MSDLGQHEALVLLFWTVIATSFLLYGARRLLAPENRFITPPIFARIRTAYSGRLFLLDLFVVVLFLVLPVGILKGYWLSGGGQIALALFILVSLPNLLFHPAAAFAAFYSIAGIALVFYSWRARSEMKHAIINGSGMILLAGGPLQFTWKSGLLTQGTHLHYSFGVVALLSAALVKILNDVRLATACVPR